MSHDKYTVCECNHSKMWHDLNLQVCNSKLGCQCNKFKRRNNDHFSKSPWRHVYRNMKFRCSKNNAPSNRWYKKIKVVITLKQLEALWFRDKAFMMEKPSIDRIDPRGNYTLQNCRFIEQRLNSALKSKPKTSKFVGIFFDKFHKKWVGERNLNGKEVKTRKFDTEKEAVSEYYNKFGIRPINTTRYLAKRSKDA